MVVIKPFGSWRRSTSLLLLLLVSCCFCRLGAAAAATATTTGDDLVGNNVDEEAIAATVSTTQTRRRGRDSKVKGVGGRSLQFFAGNNFNNNNNDNQCLEDDLIVRGKQTTRSRLLLQVFAGYPATISNSDMFKLEQVIKDAYNGVSSRQCSQVRGNRELVNVDINPASIVGNDDTSAVTRLSSHTSNSQRLFIMEVIVTSGCEGGCRREETRVLSTSNESRSQSRQLLQGEKQHQENRELWGGWMMIDDMEEDDEEEVSYRGDGKKYRGTTTTTTTTTTAETRSYRENRFRDFPVTTMNNGQSETMEASPRVPCYCIPPPRNVFLVALQWRIQNMVESGSFSNHILSILSISEDHVMLPGENVGADATAAATTSKLPASRAQGGSAFKTQFGPAFSKSATKSPSSATSPPTRRPTPRPSKFPTRMPVTPFPVVSPTPPPVTNAPTESPTPSPTTKQPTRQPTKNPTGSPTRSPTRSPTPMPTPIPTGTPTPFPTPVPTAPPTTTSPTPSSTSCSTEDEQVECCEDSDCDDDFLRHSRGLQIAEEMICFNSNCINESAFRFTLSWEGNDDLDIYAQTPAGAIIFHGNPFDPTTGGRLGDGGTNQDGEGFHVENIYFPDRAPSGTYMFFVVPFEIRDPPDTWTISVYVDGVIVDTHMGTGPSMSFPYVRP